MQQSGIRVPLSGVILWFLMILVGVSFFPATFPCASKGWFGMSISCLFWLVFGATTLALLADYLAQEIKPLIGTDAEDYVLIVGLGLFCLGLSAWSHHLDSSTSASQVVDGEQAEKRPKNASSRIEQELSKQLDQILEEDVGNDVPTVTVSQQIISANNFGQECLKIETTRRTVEYRVSR